MKIQVNHVTLEPDSAYITGQILVKGYILQLETHRWRSYDSSFILTLQFSDSQNLLPLYANDKLVVEYQDPWGRPIKLETESETHGLINQTVHENFRQSLGSFNTLCLQRLKRACSSLVDSLKLKDL